MSKSKFFKIGVVVFIMLSVISIFSFSFAYLDIEEKYDSPGGTNKVLIVVNSSIYDAIIDPYLMRYIGDLEAEDYSIKLITYISGTAQELKDCWVYLRNTFWGSSFKGVIFVGDMPNPYFEIYSDFGELGYTSFPIDLFYTDLDGIWGDSNNNGIYNTHEGNFRSEIWLGRLDASLIYNETMDQVALLKNYFDKNHAYRIGTMPVTQYGLAFPDDDWAGKGSCNLERIYNGSSLEIINDVNATTAAAYKTELGGDHEWVHVVAHSDPYHHMFYEDNRASEGFVENTEIMAIDPKAVFFTLEACSNARYTEYNYMGGNYIFSKTKGLLAVGGTKTLKPLDYDWFYALLSAGNRKNLGEAFQIWFNDAFWIYSDFRSRLYGMTLLGDPTLSLDPPRAVIDYINPTIVWKSGQSVELKGSGNIVSAGASIVAYSWRSSINGYLSGDSLFTTTALSAGIHTIYLKVQDNKGRWSSEASATVTVDSTAPSKPVVADGGVYTSSAATLQASWTGAVDPESGITEYQYMITQDAAIKGIVIKNWTSIGTTSSVTATGLTLAQGKTYYFGVKAKNGAGTWSAVGYSNGIKVDTTAPSKPVVTDGGVYTNNSTTLNASWTGSVDSESGIAQYQYRITQDTTTGTVIKAWTSTGTTPSVTATGLTLVQGKTYYFGVKAKNGAGTWSAVGYSNGIRVNTPPTAPIVTGPSSGAINTGYSFTAETSDADGDYLHLNFIFLGTDGTEHLVAIWYNNPATQDYSWDKPGNYYVKVSAEDDKGGGSSWTRKDIVIK